MEKVVSKEWMSRRSDNNSNSKHNNHDYKCNYNKILNYKKLRTNKTNQ